MSPRQRDEEQPSRCLGASCLRFCSLVKVIKTNCSVQEVWPLTPAAGLLPPLNPPTAVVPHHVSASKHLHHKFSGKTQWLFSTLSLVSFPTVMGISPTEKGGGCKTETTGGGCQMSVPILPLCLWVCVTMTLSVTWRHQLTFESQEHRSYWACSVRSQSSCWFCRTAQTERGLFLRP